MSYSADSFVAGEQPTTSKWNKLFTNDASFNDGTGIAPSAVTPEKLLTGAGTSWAWQTWAPTLGAITIGNGTTVAKYTQIGKTIHAYLEITWGSGTSQSGTFTFTLPATASASYTASRHVIGEVSMWDNSASQLYSARAFLTANTTVTPRLFHSDGAFLYSPSTDIISATQPVTWAVSDVFSAYLTYEAA